ncbi:uncharacterized protein UV8b_06025 [Ustilaginoidea virens]|uniref:Tat pathway signal sequence n=1 Tax=Ustilaginoidea virens TaxID=1159556 RepID=A0A0A1VA92_USTVR|nr:uncharacterized protein UV8b_06025 [Ustilaginoidea virens]QUC21781.1 hypothetical protein UV8b_06025 [Ustilaginoidea virens]GAO17431.1 hypothetical protein UVI_02052280 [Ustilaginoidea virens]FAA01160.1 TPA: hypothetical protein [Ustilaginoidea virens]
MARDFTKDESERASSEFLIDENFPRKKTKRWSQRPFRHFCIVLGLLVGVFELVVLETFFVHISWQSKSPSALGELNALVPNFPIHPVLFRHDPMATIGRNDENSRNATQENWLSYIPRGNGFIAVNNAEKYTLPDPIPFRGKSAYSIAVFHQIHCLHAIMNVFNELTRPASKHARDSDRGHDGHMDSHAHRHIDHCFRYLRQSLVCCGDTALEGQDPNTKAAGTDGTGAVHMCRDFDGIRAWAEEHRIVDTKHL